MKVLIIEHEAGNRKILAKMIQKYCKTLTLIGKVGSVDKACQLIRKKNPDIVFLDAEMPIAANADLISRFPHATFDIVLTAASEIPSFIASQCNAAGYLMKPINIRELQQTVDNLKFCA